MSAAWEATGLRLRENERLSGVFLPVLGLLLAVDLSFVVLNAASIFVIDGVYDVLYMGAEANLPTWWSSVKLLLAGVCFLAVAFRNPAGASPVWMALLGLVFVAMSADEVASLHEWAGNVLDGGARRSGSAFHHTGLWFLAIGVPFVVLMAVVLRKLWTALGVVPGTRGRMILGLVILLAGALAIEALGNFTFSPEGFGDAFARRLYLYSVVVEEGFEMVGSSVLLWGALIFMMHHPSLPGLAKLAQPTPRR